MAAEKHIIVITGPTGVGKTDFVDMLAEQLPIEIINADLGQCYTPLSIGTAKPEWRMSGTSHHLFDSIDEPVDFTAADYRKKVLHLIAAIRARDKIPVIVGGSLFYISTLFFAPRESQSTSQEPCATTHHTWESLHALDPERAKTIHPNDQYRIDRAHALWRTMGVKPSLLAPHFAPVAPAIHMVFLSRDKDDLHQRIEKRVDSMLESGWLCEVRSLRSTLWEPFLQRKKLIGYNELLDFLAMQEENTEALLDTVAVSIAQRTRAYAKRQHTFWRMLARKIKSAHSAHLYSSKITIESANLTSLDLDLYIKQLSDAVFKNKLSG